MNKRDLGNQFCNGEEPERASGNNVDDSNGTLDDAFTKVLKWPQCSHILVTSLKNIEAKINEIYETNQVTQDREI